ncbi:MAG: beta galactosidase jelly roll domain-containing protein [Arachidicoccus sp.]|nr:beta galactosidase jelly roll domain-containing protein [Arachidicoccus sp.]
MQRYNIVQENASIISSKEFNSKNWLNAIVPGTVLTSLVNDNVYPDPYFGDINKRNKHIIPDMADSGREFYHYWYRTTFKVPTSFTQKRIHIKFNGINYKANVWLNGKQIGNIAGMFEEKDFDVTDIINKKEENILAVDVDPVDVPGQSGIKLEKRNGAKGENSNGGDGLIGENVTMLMSAGWDFTFDDGIRDRNTGIWKEVELYATGDIVLNNPFVVSYLPLPDTSYSKEIISIDITNLSDHTQSGFLKGKIKENGIEFEKSITLSAHETKTFIFNTNEYPALKFNHPKLWWPINKGQQNLYNLDFSFVQSNKTTHQIHTQFGVREITSDQKTPDSSRRFLVNGYPVFIRGSNWVPEAMLKNSAERTYTELLYTHQSGINMLRLWGGGIAESDYFFHLCDSLGILVWTEYWITGDTRFPDDKQLYLDNLKSTVLRIRNHPSLAYYVSSNESTEVAGAHELIQSLDSSRGYQMQSECCGVHDGSPYKYENPMQYFENTASERGSRIDGFNPEYGTPCLPIYESLKKMMSKKDLWPINDSVWNYLDGGGFHQMTTKYKDAVNQFGYSKSIEEFSEKAQLVGAMNYRSIWEVWNFNKFAYGNKFASGFFFWYHNSPIPQVCSRLYDWYLQPTAALYYSQNGTEPLHAQFDYLTNKVSVYNDYRKSFKDYKVVAQVYDINSKKVWEHEVNTDIPSDGVVNNLFEIYFPDNISQVHFINLILKNKEGKQVTSSFYWRSKDKYQGAWTLTGPAVSGFDELNQLPQTIIHTQAVNINNKTIKITVKNESGSLAFFNQLLLENIDGMAVNAAFYTDNFFSLLPGESKTVTISYLKENTDNKALQLIVKGYNIKEQVIKL